MNDNLKPLNTRTKEEQREIQRKGGKLSGASRRKRKTFREAAEMLLSMKLTPKEAEELAKKLGVSTKGWTQTEAIVIAQVNQARRGNTKAFVALRDTMGEKPTDHVEHTVNGAPGMVSFVDNGAEDK